jgi:hypothetical protein
MPGKYGFLHGDDLDCPAGGSDAGVLMIFRRLKARGHEWRYAFPRLGLVDLRPLREAVGEPTGSVEDEAQRDRALAELRQSLDASHRQAVEAAWERPPPETVQTYQGVYGWFPEGWPPEVSSSDP